MIEIRGKEASRREIDKEKHQNIHEVLREVGGIEIYRHGPSYQVRAVESE